MNPKEGRSYFFTGLRRHWERSTCNLHRRLRTSNLRLQALIAEEKRTLKQVTCSGPDRTLRILVCPSGECECEQVIDARAQHHAAESSQSVEWATEPRVDDGYPDIEPFEAK